MGEGREGKGSMWYDYCPIDQKFNISQISCLLGSITLNWPQTISVSEHSALINLFPSSPALSCLLLLTYAHTLLLCSYSFIRIHQCEERRAIAVWDPCRAVPAAQQDPGRAEEEGDTGLLCPSTSEESAVINQGAPTHTKDKRMNTDTLASIHMNFLPRAKCQNFTAKWKWTRYMLWHIIMK